jgi:molecular chaperone GrpE
MKMVRKKYYKAQGGINMAEQEQRVEETENTKSSEVSEETRETKAQSDAASEEGGTEETAGEEEVNTEDADGEDTEENEEETPEGEDPKTWAEKRAAKKQAKQDKKTQGYREQIEHLEDRVKRQLAEFENFRNRTEKEKQSMFETGAKSVIEKMLPIVDNFERGLATVPEDRKEDPFVDGMSRIYKQLLKELENIDVKPIEAVGKEFDPTLHNAVMQVESEEFESGMVAQELQKGYTYRGSVVRHSMVSVVV